MSEALTFISLAPPLCAEATLSSDFIAGFCGETEAEHQETLSLLRLVQYDMAYIFAYSRREKTHAHHRFEDDVAAEVKSRRVQELVDVFHQGAAARNAGRVGTEAVVLVDGTSKRSERELVGRSDGNVKIVFPSVEVSERGGGKSGRKGGKEP